MESSRTSESSESALAPPNAACQMVRHALATLAYRAAKAVREAPPAFATHRISPTSRTPAEILAHMGDLMDWALSMAQNRTKWRDAPVQRWDADVERFFAGVTALDRCLAETAVDQAVLLGLVQGPIADALTHTGQLTLLRRAADAPIRGENYQMAQIAAGQTGLEQPAPRREFD